MQAVVSIGEMRRADEAAVALVGHDTLVERAGEAVASFALELLGDPEGRRVVVLCGPGFNGADGRVAAQWLRQAGAVVEEHDSSSGDIGVESADLVIDAMFGTGLSRDVVAPKIADEVPVLSVDIASGVDGDTGMIHGQAIHADWTLAIQTLKVGHLLGEGPQWCGSVRVADIGIALESTMALLEPDDRFLLAPKPRDEHKWSVALGVIAGSPGMEGAAILCAQGAQRAGAGMVRLVTTALPGSAPWPIEAVRAHFGADELVTAVQDLDRCHALVVGPGLGRTEEVASSVRRIVAERQVPIVLDADGMFAFENIDQLAAAVSQSDASVIVTPHEGELARLMGASLDEDRVGQLRALAEATGAVVLLKGPTTMVATPEPLDGLDVLFITQGTTALATAGTGDVLAGVIGALLARGLPALHAAGIGALVHGLGAQASQSVLIASDLPYLVGEVLDEVLHGS
jgi:ADP-dependent NAD(P)H-hydrate dehydratase / NAD(P)H-hydrate epimerase